ncbi:hypothetical protein GGI04_001442 [Coemansia thaxteri]|nr:hypothetical protein GGI04_001442 [Coemansia thaxteri]
MAMPFVTTVGYARPKENRPHRFAYDYGSVDPGMFTPAPERIAPKRAPKRTVAYSIPLPDNGSSQIADDRHHSDQHYRHQGHVLGVNALALSFEPIGHSTSSQDELPGDGMGGVLFSGGRDGVVKAWDLNFPVSCHGGSWSIDRQRVRQTHPRQTTLRASQVVHSDWVNDIVVVNGGETVVSASSDQTVRAWSPYRTDERPHAIGSHLDYVKALAYSEHRRMVISGGLDRKIKLWDLGTGSGSGGLVASLQEFGDASVSSSVYTLACNAQGSTVVSGSPEKLIRVWDTRVGRQLTTLAGHTDHIRAVMLSADSELVLSGSSDSTVKLWSMRMRRCLSTFAHHTDSVWALHATHPRFRTFYSASRDGLVAKTIGAGAFSDDVPPSSTTARRTSLTSRAAEDSQAGVVCVAVAKESQGVVKIVAADDTYIWTATKGTRLNRWLDVSARPRGASLTSQSSQFTSTQLPAATAAEHAVHFASEYLEGSRAAANMSADMLCATSTDEETSEITQQSLMEPWLAFGLGNSGSGSEPPHSASGAHAISDHGAVNSRHRRNRTVDYSSAGPINHPTAMTQALSVSNVISPVLMAIQAEQARRIVVKDTADKVPYHDARSAGSIGSGRDAAATGQVPPHLSPIDFALSSGSGERILTGGGSDPPLYAPELPLPTTSLIRARHAEAAGLSVTTAPAATATAISTQSLHSAKIGGVVIPVRSEPDETIYGRYGLHRHKILDNKRQVLAQDTRGRVSLWDILLCCRVYEFPEFERAQDEAIKSDVPYANIFGTDFDAIHAALSGEPESVSSWCHVDTRVGVLTVHLDESWVWDAEVHIDEVDRVPDSAIAAMGDHERVNIGQWMLKRLFKAYTRHRMRRGPLSRHDAAQLNRWVTQIPAGAVISSRQPPLGPVPPSAAASAAAALGAGHELPPASPAAPAMARSATARLPTLASPVPSTQAVPAPKTPGHGSSIASQLLATAHEVGLCSDSGLRKHEQDYENNGNESKPLPAVGLSVPTSPPAVGSAGHHHSPSIDTATSSSKPTPLQPQQSQQQHQPQQPQQQQLRADEDEAANSSTGSTGKFMNRLLSMRVRRQKSSLAVSSGNVSATPLPAIPTSSVATANMVVGGGGGGDGVPSIPSNNRSISAPNGPAAATAASAAVGRVTAAGVAMYPPTGATTTNNAATTGADTASAQHSFGEWAGPRHPTDTERALALLQHTAAPWAQLYSPLVCPQLELPQNIVVQVFQEHFEASQPFSIYRSTVDAMESASNAPSLSIFCIIDDPLLSFELCMPAWLTDFLLFNRLPVAYQEPAKIPFVLSPVKGATLPPFPNPGARLVANRMLRARKLAIYVVDKLGLPLMTQPAPNFVNAVDVCLRIYHKTAEIRALLLSRPNCTAADVFSATGETLCEEERAALADISAWQEFGQQRNTNSEGALPGSAADRPTEYAGRPELYLNLFCKGKRVLPKYTLATIKATAWKASSDIQVNYDWAEFVKRRVSKSQALVASSNALLPTSPATVSVSAGAGAATTT